MLLPFCSFPGIRRYFTIIQENAQSYFSFLMISPNEGKNTTTAFPVKKPVEKSLFILDGIFKEC